MPIGIPTSACQAPVDPVGQNASDPSNAVPSMRSTVRLERTVMRTTSPGRNARAQVDTCRVRSDCAAAGVSGALEISTAAASAANAVVSDEPLIGSIYHTVDGTRLGHNLAQIEPYSLVAGGFRTNAEQVLGSRTGNALTGSSSTSPRL